MRPTRLVLVAAALAVIPSYGAWSAPSDSFRQTAENRLMEGVTYQELHTGQPETIHVVTIAPGAKVAAYASLSNDQVAEPKVSDRLEKTSHACSRRGCVAGINGDYFCAEGHCTRDESEPEGGIVSNGRMLRSPYSPVGWREQQLMLDDKGCPLAPTKLTWQGSVSDQNGGLDISGVNVDRFHGQLVLYTAAYGSRTRTADSGAEMILKLSQPDWLGDLGQPVQAAPVRFRQAGNSRIGDGEIVLSGSGKMATALQELWQNRRNAVTVELGSRLPVWNSIGAKPLLLLNGKYTGQWAEKELNPITIFAWKPDCTRFLIAVDGRQANSAGVTNEQAANLAANLGAVTAFGLDGGGSTTMVGPGGQVMNDPSDPGGERAVSDSLLFVPLHGEAALRFRASSIKGQSAYERLPRRAKTPPRVKTPVKPKPVAKPKPAKPDDDEAAPAVSPTPTPTAHRAVSPPPAFLREREPPPAITVFAADPLPPARPHPVGLAWFAALLVVGQMFALWHLRRRA